MKKAVIFGAGSTGIKVFERVKYRNIVLYFTDNNRKRWGEEIQGVPIKPTSELYKRDFDIIYIATTTGLNIVYDQLIKDFNVPRNKIIRNEVELPFLARLQFLESFAKYVYTSNICGNVCEAGVFQGEFAKRINESFPDRKLYLFDTFLGFNYRDIAVEREMQYSTVDVGQFSITSVELVLEKMPNRDICTIKKGLFPDTFDLWSEKFCFVNLDMDLYQPTKAGLEIFFPRLAGVYKLSEGKRDKYFISQGFTG